MHLILTRHAYLPSCTLGTMQVGVIRVQTLERPWISNPAGPGGQLSISCVPDGLYAIEPHSSDKHPDVFALVGEPLGVYHHSRPAAAIAAGIPRWGRTEILLHGAFKVLDVIGCIGVGMRALITGNEHVLNDSRTALDELRRQLKGALPPHSLEIRPTAGTTPPRAGAAQPVTV